MVRKSRRGLRQARRGASWLHRSPSCASCSPRTCGRASSSSSATPTRAIRTRGSGTLGFTDAAGGLRKVLDPATIADVLSHAPNLELVVFNGCKSAGARQGGGGAASSPSAGRRSSTTRRRRAHTGAFATCSIPNDGVEMRRLVPQAFEQAKLAITTVHRGPTARARVCNRRPRRSTAAPTASPTATSTDGSGRRAAGVPLRARCRPRCSTASPTSHRSTSAAPTSRRRTATPSSAPAKMAITAATTGVSARRAPASRRWPSCLARDPRCTPTSPTASSWLRLAASARAPRCCARSPGGSASPSRGR